MTSAATDPDIDAFADRFVAAIVAGDIDTVLSMYAPDATIWHNFDDADQTPEQNAKTMRMMHRLIPGFDYHDIRRTILPDGFWQQHVLRASTPKGELAMPAALRVSVQGGRITRLEEYLDPAAFAAVV